MRIFSFKCARNTNYKAKLMLGISLLIMNLPASNQSYAAEKLHNACAAEGRTQRSAKIAYQRLCDQPRRDCDKIGNSWICSSQQIGAAAPNYAKKPRPSNQYTTMVLNLVGTGDMYIDAVPDAEIPGEYVDAWCFDLDLIDLKTGKKLGQATDCLDNSRQEYALSESGIAMIGTTYFNLPGGTLAIQGRTTVQPRNWPTREFTHVTGGNSAGNAVLYGSGKYQKASGTARLSGMVDLSKFKGQVGNPISFDCIFVVDVKY